MKSSNIGGQAVLEGIMMKNRETYSVASGNQMERLKLIFRNTKEFSHGRHRKRFLSFGDFNLWILLCWE